MQLEFEPEDEAALEAMDALLRRLERWRRVEGMPMQTWPAEQAMAVKWRHLDGHLTRWTVAALSEHLLTYVPRMAVRPGEDWSDVPVGLIGFIRFLDAERLLAPGSDPPDVLEAEVVELVPDLVVAMDAAHPGGLPLPAAHDLLVADLPPPAPGAVLPPMDLPSGEQAAEAARATPAVQSLVTFLGWLGERRRLTAAGNLRLADAKELVEVLGTDDEIDAWYGGPTRSSTELRWVDLVFRLADDIGLVEGEGSRLTRVTTPEDVSGKVLEVYRDAADHLLVSGDLSSVWQHGNGPPFQGFLDESVTDLLLRLLIAEEPVAFADLVAEAHEALDDDDADGGRLWRIAEEALAEELDGILDGLEWVGLVDRGEDVGLTGLGRWWLRPMLEEAGWTVPEPGSLIDADAGQLLTAVGTWPEEVARAEVAAWLGRRPDGVDQLVEAARRAEDAGERALAVEAMGLLDPDVAEAAVRRLREDPATRAVATLWLVDRGVEPPSALDPGDALAVLVEQLETLLVGGGPEALVEGVVNDLQADARLVEGLWSVDDPAVETVLDALAAHAPKRLAKAARKALFKRGAR